VEKRKAGSHTTAIHEAQIKTILSVMNTGSRVPIGMMRDLLRPIFPPGTSLDANSKLVWNFRLKAKRMLAKGFVGDINSQTITEEEREALLSTKDPKETPVFLTEIFQQFTELLKEALADGNDLHQITNYLNSLEDCNPTFMYRIGYVADGTATGLIWQTGVMRKDFELYGDVLFVDRLGQSLNDKGCWPLITIGMLFLFLSKGHGGS
jgi:hypothetical protein